VPVATEDQVELANEHLEVVVVRKLEQYWLLALAEEEADECGFVFALCQHLLHTLQKEDFVGIVTRLLTFDRLHCDLPQGGALYQFQGTLVLLPQVALEKMVFLLQHREDKRRCIVQTAHVSTVVGLKGRLANVRAFAHLETRGIQAGEVEWLL